MDYKRFKVYKRRKIDYLYNDDSNLAFGNFNRGLCNILYFIHRKVIIMKFVLGIFLLICAIADGYYGVVNYQEGRHKLAYFGFCLAVICAITGVVDIISAVRG